MSKINAVRLINLNYNNNAISISDEIFHMNGESTLLSLRNGGGKSVLVQMLMAPFVHKRYRDAKDRPFESYFSTNKPTFIMVEWMLDQGAGYVLTGMMVRKNQDFSEENQEQREALEVLNFITEYKDRCMQDIFHLPVVERTKKEILLKNFGSCKQLFENYKRDRSIPFFYFDMNHAAQSRQYFDKLKEYQIHYKEWETIIKKVNLKESGLSDLFADCRDEKGLVEKWFIDAVESKLNKEKNRMKEFQSIIEKYVGQYKDNKSKIERRDTIRKFKEEADMIMAEAFRYQAASKEVEAYQSQIAALITELTKINEAAEHSKTEIEREMAGIEDEISFVEYEKISKEIYELQTRARYHSNNMEMISAERDAIEQEMEQTKRVLHLLDCAKQQEEVDGDEQEYLRAQQKLKVSRQQEEDLEPERKSLGYTLRRYYETEQEEAEKKERETRFKIETCEKNLTDTKGQIKEHQERLLKEKENIAELRTRIRVFDEKEELFNRRHKEDLGRSILGEYEPGALEIRMQTYEKQLEALSRERISNRGKLETSAEERKALSRTMDDKKQAFTVLSGKIEQEEKQKEQYEKELSERKNMLRYLDMGEQDLFSMEKILAESGRKLMEIERVRRGMDKEEDELKKEYLRLTQGKVLELPEEFEAMLENRGIHYVYGMEWMRKNGYTRAENQKLVRRHPFLPYALILSGQEADKLMEENSEGEGAVYTSFPIPVMIREELEQSGSDTGKGMIRLEGIHFYVYFNENLLNEKKLKEMALEMERKMDRLNGIIVQKRKEYAEYFERQEKIKNQRVSQENYQANAAAIQDAKDHGIVLESEIEKIAEEIGLLERSIKDLQNRTRQLDQEISGMERKLEDFLQFCTDYEIYTGERTELLQHEKETKHIEERLKLYAGQCERFESEYKTLEHGLQDLLRKKDSLGQKKSQYLEYQEMECRKGTIQELEARYAAITMKFSAERQELEEGAVTAGKRLQKAKDELFHLQSKFRLEEGAWKETVYNRDEEAHQEDILKDCQVKKAGKDLAWTGEDKAVALIHLQISAQRKRMSEECRREEPLPKADIITEDFDAKINRLLYERKEKQKEEEAVSKKISSYEGNLSALAEYTNFTQNAQVEWVEDFTVMSRRELDECRGKLVRSYRESVDENRKCQDRLTKELNRVVRQEEFQEDFYRKPLETLLELVSDAEGVITQLSTTVMSYNSLMEKLEVDISMVEKERAKIAELLLDYTREVHENLGKIDHNSTISIRERPVKMLKIQLPDWETNESLYQVRLRDFIFELTQKGIAIFEQNKNAQEYFGTRITTKNLYDTVVGVSNVQIRLYKIEEQREYAITWTEVARNSGGEGFLSAFVILTSLLYYMRRDESDIFADRNEGKVLVMDNPFAQTNAAHLLKPLMDMAKKTNTQLICLSGLGGESIYNRFDNIYVLNLLAASLRSGMQYLKADHTRGAEPETMIVSQIEVAEQQELMF